MYGLEEVDDGEYCVFLPDGATLEVTETDEGNLAEEVVRYDNLSERPMTYSDLSSDLRSFITARTGKKFAPNADD